MNFPKANRPQDVACGNQFVETDVVSVQNDLLEVVPGVIAAVECVAVIAQIKFSAMIGHADEMCRDVFWADVGESSFLIAMKQGAVIPQTYTSSADL